MCFHQTLSSGVRISAQGIDHRCMLVGFPSFAAYKAVLYFLLQPLEKLIRETNQ